MGGKLLKLELNLLIMESHPAPRKSAQNELKLLTAVHCGALRCILFSFEENPEKSGNDEVAVLLCRVCTVHDIIKRPLYPNKTLTPWPHGNDADERRKTGFFS